MINIGATVFRAATRNRTFNPASLFSNGEEGVWYDPSKLFSMKQNSNGTVDAVVGQPVGYIEDLSGNGHHAIQATSTKKPILRETGGLYSLDFDGVDDGLVSTSIDFTSTDSMSMFAGARKTDNARNQMVFELSNIIGSYPGSFRLFCNSSNLWASQFRGTVANVIFSSNAGANDLSVLSGVTDISSRSHIFRRNAFQVGENTNSQGVGNFGNYPLNIGSRNNGVGSGIDGTISSIIIVGRVCTDSEIDAVENYISRQSGKPFIEYSQFFNYGQSLSIGGSGGAALTTSQPYNNLMFNGGLFAGETPSNLTSFVPLVEEYRETQSSETANQIVKRIEDEDSIVAKDQGAVYLGSAPGAGGKTIQELSKGTSFYSRMLTQVAAGRDIAASVEKQHRVSFINYTQGEANYYEPTTTTLYKRLLKTLLSDLNTDIKTLTAQAEDFPMAIYQLAVHRKNDIVVPNIAIAQHEVSIEDPLVNMATPMYIFDYTDNVHTTNDSNRHLGAYYGKVIKRVTRDKVSWNPLQPKSVDWQGNTIDITFDVPRAPLVLDTSWVTAEANSGFDVWDSDYSNQLNIISSVTLVDSDKVRIVLSSTPADGTHLTYAFGDSSNNGLTGRTQGPRGNLRDSEGDVDSYVDNDGVTRRLDNYAVIFQTTKWS
tara:strand:+ start:5408 stop:7372 length:1965 start_codon:yes stop_codon:yes gene_type:complete